MSSRSRSDTRVAFVLAATDQGTMIVNRLDYDKAHGGPGAVLLELSEYEPLERDCGIGILQGLLQTRGPGIALIDAGANCGAFTVPWAKAMKGWGTVLAIEPQRPVYYALCGNIAINNLFNAVAVHAAVSDTAGFLKIPVPNYREPYHSGGMSLLENPPESVMEAHEFTLYIEKVKAITIDSLKLARVDLIKLDIEGMEPEAIGGAQETIAKCKPVFVIEHLICTQDTIKRLLPDYEFIDAGINTICIPKGDDLFQAIKFKKIEGDPNVKEPEPQVELTMDGVK